MEDKYISPCKSDKVCKGCTLKRSCATKIGIPNCIKQFMDGTDIKQSINDSDKQIASLKAEMQNILTHHGLVVTEKDKQIARLTKWVGIFRDFIEDHFCSCSDFKDHGCHGANCDYLRVKKLLESE